MYRHKQNGTKELHYIFLRDVFKQLPCLYMNLILPLTFLTISFTIEAPDKSLSNWTPRYLTDFCDLMAFPLHCTYCKCQ